MTPRVCVATTALALSLMVDAARAAAPVAINPDSFPSEGPVWSNGKLYARMLAVTPAGKPLCIPSVPPEYLYITSCALSPDEPTVYITATRDQDNAPYPGAVFLVENR